LRPDGAGNRQGLGELIARRFSRAWRIVIGFLIVALCAANALNIAADLVAVGAGMHLLRAGPTTLWLCSPALSALLCWPLFLRDHFQGVQIFALALVTYIAVVFVVHLDWGSVASHTLVPHIQLTKGYIAC